MFSAKFTEFFVFDPAGMQFFVFCRSIVSSFAIGTSQDNQIAHSITLILYYITCAY